MKNDLISRRAVIEAIKDHLKAVLGENNYDEGLAYGYAAAHRHIIDIVNVLPSEQKWVPASERLPEEDKNVLVSVHFLGLDQRHKTGWNDHIKENWYVDIASHIDGNWTSYGDEYKVAKSRHIIIAWMPLPEPHREK